MKEMAWLKAGMAKGTSKEVKQHATMMLKDHEKIGATVKDYLSKHSNITMPSVDTANVVDINDKSGADWDKAWVDKMVDDHSALLDKLNSSKTEVKDADLNKIIMNTIPTVQSHLSMVKMMQDKMKK
jgi:putative membrane protein